MTRCERIYHIFKKLSTFKNNSLMNAWRKVFKTNETFDIYFYLERLYNEIKLLEIELEKLNVPQKIYTPILDKTKNITKNYSFNVNTEHITLTNLELERFYGFSFQGLDEEVIEFDFSEDLEIMINSLSEIQDTELKLILNDIISSFHKIQTLPLIVGNIGLEESFKELYCKINVNIDEIQKAPNAYKEKLTKLYLFIDKTLTFSEKWIKRGDEIIKLIENLGG